MHKGEIFGGVALGLMGLYGLSRGVMTVPEEYGSEEVDGPLGTILAAVWIASGAFLIVDGIGNFELLDRLVESLNSARVRMIWPIGTGS